MNGIIGHYLHYKCKESQELGGTVPIVHQTCAHKIFLCWWKVFEQIQSWVKYFAYKHVKATFIDNSDKILNSTPQHI